MAYGFTEIHVECAHYPRVPGCFSHGNWGAGEAPEKVPHTGAGRAPQCEAGSRQPECRWELTPARTSWPTHGHHPTRRRPGRARGSSRTRDSHGGRPGDPAPHHPYLARTGGAGPPPFPSLPPPSSVSSTGKSREIISTPPHSRVVCPPFQNHTAV